MRSMVPTPVDRAASPLMQALRSCTDHLEDDEVYEVCARGGEQELNDLLRHAANRIVRPDGWIVQREQSRTGVRRADLLMSDLGSGAPFAVIEAKMRYVTDAVESQDYVAKGLRSDAAKLTNVRALVPRFLLVWAPYFAVVRRRLRWMAGHDAAREGWLPRVSLDECRTGLLVAVGAQPALVTVRTTDSSDGQLTLDA